MQKISAKYSPESDWLWAKRPKKWFFPRSPTKNDWIGIVNNTVQIMEKWTFSLQQQMYTFVKYWSIWVKYVKSLRSDFVKIQKLLNVLVLILEIEWPAILWYCLKSFHFDDNNYYYFPVFYIWLSSVRCVNSCVCFFVLFATNILVKNILNSRKNISYVNCDWSVYFLY